MLAYALLCLSLAAAVLVLVGSISREQPSTVMDKDTAQSCCWAPKGDPTRCYPCQ
jgi:hypothetical protein